MSYFATEYTIHFDDTMAYGSHHFLTAFKFQCAARETFLFGELIYDVASVRQSLDEIRLLTMDAYARNLPDAYRILYEHYRYSYVVPGESRPRAFTTTDAHERSIESVATK